MGSGRPWHLWLVGLASLVWNAGGAYDFVMTRSANAAYLAPFSAAERAWFAGFPGWMVAGWAAGVWGALIGSLLLLARSRWAVAAFAVSLAGFVVGMLYQHAVATPPPALATPSMLVFDAVLGGVTVLLLWYAVAMRRRGVLR